MTIHESPEHIALLLEIGIETGDEGDRILALSAANAFDAKHGTAFGQEVIEVYMAQLGLAIEEDTELVSEDGEPKHDVHSSETSRVAKLYQEVFVAIGPALGVNLEMSEYIADDKEEIPLIVALEKPSAGVTRVAPLAIYDPETAYVVDASENRPFITRQRYMTNRSQTNFMRAIRAVMGKVS